MTYASAQDLIDRFGQAELIQLTDRSVPAAGAVDSTVVARKLTAADAEIDARIAVRYTVPLSPVPQIIIDKACDIARFLLYSNEPTEHVRTRYKDAIAFLDAVAAGNATLGLETAAPASGGTVQFEESQRVFGRGNL